jgi:hypothetical protein
MLLVVVLLQEYQHSSLREHLRSYVFIFLVVIVLGWLICLFGGFIVHLRSLIIRNLVLFFYL